MHLADAAGGFNFYFSETLNALNFEWKVFIIIESDYCLKVWFLLSFLASFMDTNFIPCF